MSETTEDTLATATLDRRIRSILARISGSSGGESLAALSALERMLPPSTTLADVLFVGLHHMRQDRVDPSLIREIQVLHARLGDTDRREESLMRRVAQLEKALSESLAQLTKMQDGFKKK